MPGQRRRKPEELPALPPLVNRLLELRLLREHLAGVAAGGPGHALLVLGESGVGKSRLVAELRADAAKQGLTTLAGQCLGRGAEPLLPIKDALAAHLGRTTEHVRRSLLRASPQLLDAVPFVGAFLAKVGETLFGERRVAASIDGVSEELSRLLLGLAGKRGLCLIVEDLHDADGDTLFFLNYFIRKLHPQRVLAVFTIQLEGLREAPQLADLVARWNAEGYANLTVFPLERAHVGEYVHALGGLGRPVDDTFVDQLFSLTGGNPFYLAETLRLLAGGGPEAVAGAMPELAVPPRVDAVLRRRLARADPATLQFMQVASVLLETTNDIEAMAALMETSVGAAVRAFAAARDLMMMKEDLNGEIAFTHSLMRRAVYLDLGTTYQRYLHEQAARWSEQEGRPAAAAFHFGRAGKTADLVRTGLAAAEQAERAGMYHSALALYEQVRPYVSIARIGPQLAGVMITLGEWTAAGEVLDLLPPDDGRVRLLRSRLVFVLGRFRQAQEEALAALNDPQTDRSRALTQLADIALYLGDFAEARRYAQQSAEADPDGARVPYYTLVGITAYHDADLDTAAVQYQQALELVRRDPESSRDWLTETMLVGNLANVALARGDVSTAERLHTETLRRRREIADARGALHSLHALGRCRLAAGDRPAAVAHLDEADELAASLGETLERAKIAQTRSEMVRADDPELAYTLARAALESFERSECRYDIVNARIAVGAAAAALGHDRESITLRVAARRDIALRGYRLLAMANPEVAGSAPAERVAGALTAYACADAVGLPYENHPPTSDTDEQIETLHAEGIWSVGDTSDDTALTLIAADCLVAARGAATAEQFLDRLAAQAPPVPGLGPSTTAAIENHRTGGAIPADQAGATNGGAMRALPCGWATAPDDRDTLLRRTVELTRATHRSPEALAAACAVAACGSWSVEGAGTDLLLQVARETTDAAQQRCGPAPRFSALLDQVIDGSWQAPAEGVEMDAGQTVAAALHCVRSAGSLRDGILAAVRLGGDTDTVAALVGGLLGARMTPAEVGAALPWSGGVRLPDPRRVRELADGLIGLRTGPTG